MLFSEARKAYAEAAGHRGWCVWVWPTASGLSKEPGWRWATSGCVAPPVSRTKRQPFTFFLVPPPVLRTSKHLVAWPQGDLSLGGGSWGWPYKAQDKNHKIDADHPACFSFRFVIFFNRQSRIFSHIFALRISTVFLGLEPPTMRFLFERSVRVERVQRTSHKVTVGFCLCRGKRHGGEGVLGLRPLRGGQDDCLPSNCA